MSGTGERRGERSPLFALIALLTAVPRLRLLSAAVVVVSVLGVADYATGSDVSFGVVYLVPVFLAAATSCAAGVAVSAAAAATWSLIEISLRTTPFSAAWVPTWILQQRSLPLGLFPALTTTDS